MCVEGYVCVVCVLDSLLWVHWSLTRPHCGFVVVCHVRLVLSRRALYCQRFFERRPCFTATA